MATSARHPDLEVFQQMMTTGIPAIGKLHHSGVYEYSPELPELTQQELEYSSPHTNHAF